MPPHAGEHHIQVDHGLLRAYYAPAPRYADGLWQYAASASAFSEHRLTELDLVLADKHWRIGLIAHVYVDAEVRGRGAGRGLLQRYRAEIMPYTDIDLVFASVELPQLRGFSLLQFYGKLGFEPVMASRGDLLMVSKEKAPELRRALRGPPLPASFLSAEPPLRSPLSKPTLCHARTRADADQIDVLKAVAHTIDAEAFAAAVDLDSWLDEGETLDDAMQTSEDMLFWAADANGVACFGVTSMGMDLLFAPDGSIPAASPPAQTQELGLSALAWVLEPAGGPIAAARAGQERLVFEDDRCRQYQNANGDRRYQLLHGDQVVGGLFVVNGQIDAIYTRQAHRREGVGRQLLALARADTPALRHSDSLTAAGKAFRGGTDESFSPGF